MLANCVITVGECNGTPGLVINSGGLNSGVNIAPNSLAPGRHTIKFTFDPDSKINFYITGKDHTSDTAIDTDGNIIADKFIKFELIMLEHLLLNEPELYVVDFDPYFGLNEEIKTLTVPKFDQWPMWYLEIFDQVNKQ